MQQFTTFVVHHWELWLAFVVLLILFMIFELKNKITGLPQLDPQSATLLINREDPLVLDLRDNASFLKGHIVNAVNIPVAEIANKQNIFDKYKGKIVLLICPVGQPPQKIAAQLQTMGFDKIQVLQGGMQTWTNANLPVVKGK